MILTISLGIIFSTCHREHQARKVKLASFPDSLSYALGYLYGVDFAEAPFDFNFHLIYQGMINSQEASFSLLTEEQIMKLIDRFQEVITANYSQENEFITLKNQNAGREYMLNNASNPEVFIHESGLQYKILSRGKGKKVSVESKVTLHYTGKLINGETFDSSRLRNEPLTISVAEVFRGWEIGLQLMHEGDRYEFVFPDSLAFGEVGMELIEPGAYVIYDIEIIQVEN